MDKKFQHEGHNTCDKMIPPQVCAAHVVSSYDMKQQNKSRLKVSTDFCQ